MSDRAEREREFWNRARTEGESARLRVEKYYAIAGARLSAYEDVLRRYARARGRMLEVGCSTGGTSIQLAQDGGYVTGVDIADEALGQARDKAAAAGIEVDFVAADGADLPFDDDCFDVLFGSAVVHHLDIPRFAREAARVVRPGGCAVFLEPLGHNPLIRGYRRLTPRARTIDERPLLVEDLAVLAGYWGRMSVIPFDLATLATVPFRGASCFPRALAVARGADRLIFRVPLLRRYAWFALIDLRDPL